MTRHVSYGARFVLRWVALILLGTSLMLLGGGLAAWI